MVKKRPRASQTVLKSRGGSLAVGTYLQGGSAASGLDIDCQTTAWSKFRDRECVLSTSSRNVSCQKQC